MFWRRSRIRELALVVAMIALGVVAVIAMPDNSQGSPGTSQQAMSPTIDNTTVATSTVAVAIPTQALTIPPGARIATVDEAIVRAVEVARGIDSPESFAPNVIKVDLMTLRDGILAADRAAGDDSETNLAAWDPATLNSTVVWRVQLDGEDFPPLLCRAGDECRPARTFIVTFNASSGGVVDIRYGVPVPQP